jgi:hypothetical protein
LFSVINTDYYYYYYYCRFFCGSTYYLSTDSTLNLSDITSKFRALAILISQRQSYFATDGQSVSQSVGQSVLALRTSRTHDQILAVVKTVVVLLLWGVFPGGRTGLSCNRSQSLSVLVINGKVK